MNDLTAKRLSTIHRLLYRLTRGALGRRLVRNDVMLLTTTGHATGRPHTVPLLYFREGQTLVVIASWGGRPDHPTWYTNLLADPPVTVQVLGAKWEAVARTAGAEERAEWWPRIVAAYSGYADYQVRTDREIPVVFLEPAV